MKVFTYYRPINPEFESHDRNMLDLWRTSWARHGWEPVVLGLEDAKRHAWFEALTQRVRQLPTVNDIEYETACYERHLAMATAGGGLHTDYDVVNYRFRPGDFEFNELCSLDNPVTPAALYGSKEDYEWIARYFMLFSPSQASTFSGKSHTSDMLIISALNIPHNSICRIYKRAGWETSALVHYSTNTLGENPVNKAEKILEIRPL